MNQIENGHTNTIAILLWHSIVPCRHTVAGMFFFQNYNNLNNNDDGLKKQDSLDIS